MHTILKHGPNCERNVYFVCFGVFGDFGFLHFLWCVGHPKARNPEYKLAANTHENI